MYPNQPHQDLAEYYRLLETTEKCHNQTQVNMDKSKKQQTYRKIQQKTA